MDRLERFPRALVAGAAYSLDELLPIVELDPAHAEVVLRGWVRYYFMGHRLLGYVLASFLVAGLARLTQTQR